MNNMHSMWFFEALNNLPHPYFMTKLKSQKQKQMETVHSFVKMLAKNNQEECLIQKKTGRNRNTLSMTNTNCL